jgi:hypothetical protein
MHTYSHMNTKLVDCRDRMIDSNINRSKHNRDNSNVITIPVAEPAVPPNRKEGLTTKHAPVNDKTVEIASLRPNSSFNNKYAAKVAKVGLVMMSTVASPMGKSCTANSPKLNPPNPVRARPSSSQRVRAVLPIQSDIGNNVPSRNMMRAQIIMLKIP